MANLRKGINAILRAFARTFFDHRPTLGDGKMPTHVLVIRWDAKLGDSIVSSFFYREIRKLEGSVVTVLTVAELAEMYRNDFGADRVVITSLRPGVVELLKIRKLLSGVDVVVHLVGRIQPREIFFLWSLRARKVFSMDDELRLVTSKFGNAALGLTMAETYAMVLADLGVSPIERDYIVPIMPSATPSLLPSSMFHIAFNPFASRDDKSLGQEKSVELLRNVSDAFPCRTIGILSSPSTFAQAKRIEEIARRTNVVALEGMTTPAAVAQAVSQAEVVVTVDTAVVHMAVGLRRRLVGIYPSTDTEHNPWLPPASESTRVVFSRQDRLRYRKTGRKEMDKFEACEIVGAIRDLLAPDSPGSADFITIKARLIRGLGVASRTIARQLPMIIEGFPEISNCWPGTINLELERPLTVTDPDHRTEPLAWTPSGTKTEVFDLLRVELEFPHVATPVPAWLYVAHGSPHRGTPAIHEVIARRLDISGATTCRVRIRTERIQLGIGSVA